MTRRTNCEGEEVEAGQRRRKDCRRCTRPERVCLCTALPAFPVRLRGTVLILQHPHELKKRLATVAILRCCLDAESLCIVTGRKLQSPGANSLTDSLLEGAQRGEYPLYVLFPGAEALDLASVAAGAEHTAVLERAAGRRPSAPPPPPPPQQQQQLAPAPAPGPASAPANRGEPSSSAAAEEEECQQCQGGSPVRQQQRRGGPEAAPAAGAPPPFSSNVDSTAPGNPAPGCPVALRSVAAADPPARTGSDSDLRSCTTAAGGRQSNDDDVGTAEAAYAASEDGPTGSADAEPYSPVCAGSGHSGAGVVPYDMHADTGPSRATPEQRSSERPAAGGVVAGPGMRDRAEGAASGPDAGAAVVASPPNRGLAAAADGAGPCLRHSSAAGGCSSSARASGGGAASAGPVGTPEAAGGTGGRVPGSPPQGGLPPPAYLLLVIDGTWRQGREMFRAVAPRCLPPAGPGIQVALKPSDVFPRAAHGDQPAGSQPHDAAAAQIDSEASTAPTTAAVAPQDARAAVPCGGTSPRHTTPGALGDPPPPSEVDSSGKALDYDPEMPCLVRKEPVAGFVTTYEATARAVGLLERDPGLAAQLLAPLRLMTRLQASFSPAVLSRMRREPEPAARRKSSELLHQS